MSIFSHLNPLFLFIMSKEGMAGSVHLNSGRFINRSLVLGVEACVAEPKQLVPAAKKKMNPSKWKGHRVTALPGEPTAFCAGNPHLHQLIWSTCAVWTIGRVGSPAKHTWPLRPHCRDPPRARCLSTAIDCVLDTRRSSVH